MAEWLIAAVLKTAVPQGTQSSNLCPSAICFYTSPRKRAFWKQKWWSIDRDENVCESRVFGTSHTPECECPTKSARCVSTKYEPYSWERDLRSKTTFEWGAHERGKSLSLRHFDIKKIRLSGFFILEDFLLRQYIQWTFPFSEIELQVIDIPCIKCSRKWIIRARCSPVSTILCLEISTDTIILRHIDHPCTISIKSIRTTSMISRWKRVLEFFIQKYHKGTGEVTISQSGRIVFFIITRKVRQCRSYILEMRYSLCISSSSDIVRDRWIEGSGKDADNRDNDHEFDEGKPTNRKFHIYTYKKNPPSIWRDFIKINSRERRKHLLP